MLGRLLPPFWLHWILEVTCSGYPVTVSSVPLCLATVEIWYASPLFNSLMLISEDVVLWHSCQLELGPTRICFFQRHIWLVHAKLLVQMMTWLFTFLLRNAQVSVEETNTWHAVCFNFIDYGNYWEKCKAVLNLETNMTDLWSINFSSCLCSHLQFKFHYSHCSWPHASCGAKYAHHYVTLKYHMKNPSTFWWKVISQPFAFSCNFGSSIKFVLPPKWHMGHAINLVYWSSVSCTSTAIIHCQF